MKPAARRHQVAPAEGQPGEEQDERREERLDVGDGPVEDEAGEDRYQASSQASNAPVGHPLGDRVGEHDRRGRGRHVHDDHRLERGGERRHPAHQPERAAQHGGVPDREVGVGLA